MKKSIVDYDYTDFTLKSEAGSLDGCRTSSKGYYLYYKAADVSKSRCVQLF